MKNTALLQRIKQAKNKTEVQVLLNEGKAYEMASEKTKRKWLRAAKRIS